MESTGQLYSTHSNFINDAITVIESDADLDKEFSNVSITQRVRSPVSPTLDAIKEHKHKMKMFQLLELGNPNDIPKIRSLIENDPKRYLRQRCSSSSLVNQPNTDGQTPLYVASKYGNVAGICLLLECDADPYVQCQLGSESESCLEVAVRWNHLFAIKLLLDRVHWSKGQIRKAIKVANTSTVKNMLRQHIKALWGSFFCC